MKLSIKYSSVENMKINKQPKSLIWLKNRFIRKPQSTTIIEWDANCISSRRYTRLSSTRFLVTISNVSRGITSLYACKNWSISFTTQWLNFVSKLSRLFTSLVRSNVSVLVALSALSVGPKDALLRPNTRTIVETPTLVRLLSKNNKLL